MEHTLAPVSRLPSVSSTPHQVHARSCLVQIWAALTPQCRVGQNETRSPLDWQKFRVICSDIIVSCYLVLYYSISFNFFKKISYAFPFYHSILFKLLLYIRTYYVAQLSNGQSTRRLESRFGRVFLVRHQSIQLVFNCELISISRRFRDSAS